MPHVAIYPRLNFLAGKAYSYLFSIFKTLPQIEAPLAKVVQYPIPKGDGEIGIANKAFLHAAISALPINDPSMMRVVFVNHSKLHDINEQVGCLWQGNISFHGPLDEFP